MQAFFSGTAKMCVRELRSTEAPNVIVFYLAFISTLGALTGVVVQVRKQLLSWFCSLLQAYKPLGFVHDSAPVLSMSRPQAAFSVPCPAISPHKLRQAALTAFRRACGAAVFQPSICSQGLFFQDRAGGKLVPPTHFREIFTCLLVGLLGYGAQISLTYGLRSAKAAPAIATSYLSVVWGVLAGYFVFKEVCTLSSPRC